MCPRSSLLARWMLLALQVPCPVSYRALAARDSVVAEVVTLSRSQPIPWDSFSVCFPKSFGGKNLKRVGIILQRGILILLLCCFPCWAIFINTERLLLLLKQDPEVSRSVSPVQNLKSRVCGYLEWDVAQWLSSFLAWTRPWLHLQHTCVDIFCQLAGFEPFGNCDCGPSPSATGTT